MTREALEHLKIEKIDTAMYGEIKKRWDMVAKPLDSLGVFEDILSRIGAILGDVSLDIRKKAVVVMCADNGIVEEHISQSGQEVTAAVAASMGRGTSSVCQMAAVAGADVIPVDIGIATEEKIPGVLDKKVMRGTRNFLKEPAMTEEETMAAITVGIELVASLKEQGYRMIGTGEMGIGNTTTSAAVAAALLSCEPEEITGKGAGLSDAGLLHKTEVIRQALAKYSKDVSEPFAILRTYGGLDIAGLTGVFIGGAVYRIPVVIDGVISAVAALLAERIVSGSREIMIASHKSREPAAARILEELSVWPVIDAGLALGEGTGAVMMLSLLDMARKIYGEQTTFADIHVTPYVRFAGTEEV